MNRRMVVVGDALLDRDVDGTVERVCPDAPALVVDTCADRTRPGGAALAASLAARDGASVTLVTALADDAAAVVLRALIGASGVALVDLGLGPGSTTAEKVRVLAGGRVIVRIDRGGKGAAVGAFGEDARAAVTGAAAVLVADYGRGMGSAARGVLASEASARPLVWDPHPRGAVPIVGTHLVTPNERELFGFTPALDERLRGALSRTAYAARVVARRWQVHAVATTLGEGGALLVQGDGLPLVVPTVPVRGSDTCGAGDRFASAAAMALASGAVVSEAVEQAVVASTAFVAAGGAGVYDTEPQDTRPVDVRRRRRAKTHAVEVAERTRARGGVVVATGGCFDLLHAGHVATLQKARRLGDCLIVFVNSDASGRRLKGPSRPVQPVDDRVALLEALDCVDAVEVFDADTPVRALEAVQPDVFAKGGDYAIDDLPEARAVARWGGQAIVLPYLAGHSTTNLVQELQRRGG